MKTELETFKEDVKLLATLMGKISADWERSDEIQNYLELEITYPFDMGFDEMVADAQTWAENMEEK